MSCHCASCFPIDGNNNVINDLPLLKLRLFQKIKPVCLIVFVSEFFSLIVMVHVFLLLSDVCLLEPLLFSLPFSFPGNVLRQITGVGLI